MSERPPQKVWEAAPLHRKVYWTIEIVLMFPVLYAMDKLGVLTSNDE